MHAIASSDISILCALVAAALVYSLTIPASKSALSVLLAAVAVA
jgi:hypothetical protein